MSLPSPNDIARAWVEKWAAERPHAQSLPRELDLDRDISRNNPELCLQSIVEILTKIPAEPANRHFQALAAGPLEDLLVHHGPAVVERIDTLARQSPAFRLLLNGAWSNGINPAVVARLSKYRGNPW